MKVEFLSVKNPVWCDEAHTQIDCVVTTKHLNDLEIPFTASPNDPEDHGRILFAELTSGKYGEIGKFVVPQQIDQNFPTAPTGEIPLTVF